MNDNKQSTRSRVLWHVRMWAGIFIGAGIMWLLLRQVDLAELRESLRSVNLVLLAAAVAVYLSSFIFRTYQWKYVLTEGTRFQFRHLYSAVMIGFAGNCVLPARAGEFIRAAVLSRRERVPFTTSFASVMLTRLLDGFCFIGMLVLMLFLVKFEHSVVIPAGKLISEPFEITPDRLREATVAMGLLFSTAGLGVVVVYLLRNRSVALVRRIIRPVSSRFAEWTAEKIRTFIEGFAVLSRGKHLIGAIVTSVLAWTIAIIATVVMLRGFDTGVDMPWYTPLVIGALGNVGAMIPLSPGFVGTYHVCVIAALKLSNPAISYDTAVSFSIVVHAMQVISIIFVGIICLWAENMSVKGLSDVAVETGGATVLWSDDNVEL